MQITNVTNYSAKKQNQPAFGMKLDFTPEIIATIGEKDFQKLAQRVKGLVTELDRCELTVKGQKIPDKDAVLLSADDGCSKVETKCSADSGLIEAYLRKINSFCDSVYRI